MSISSSTTTANFTNGSDAKADRAYNIAASSGKAMYAMGVDESRVDNVLQVGGAVRRQEIPATAPVTTGEGTVIVIQPVLPATGIGEMIIRTANVSLEVQDGQEAYKQALAVCQEMGGYVAKTRFYKDDRDRQAGQVTLRIPRDKFMTALDKLSLLGKVENIATDSQDVSQEYKNLKAQLDAALVVYNKMLEALQKRQTTIPDAIRLESEISPVLYRIQDLKNRIEILNNVTSYTTITLNFHEARVSLKVLKDSSRFIKQSLLATAITSVKLFADIDFLYVADGHHRSASAAKVGALRREQNPGYTGTEEFNYFLAVILRNKQRKLSSI